MPLPLLALTLAVVAVVATWLIERLIRQRYDRQLDDLAEKFDYRRSAAAPVELLPMVRDALPHTGVVALSIDDAFVRGTDEEETWVCRITYTVGGVSRRRRLSRAIRLSSEQPPTHLHPDEKPTAASMASLMKLGRWKSHIHREK
jgi:hypothetical protein